MTDLAEALRLLGPRATLSHETAARLHGIALHDDDGTQRITVPHDRHGRGVPGWSIHRADLPTADVVVLEELRCTSAVRTLNDVARVLPHREAVCALDSALRGRVVTARDLRPLHSVQGRGARAVRAAVAAADPKSGSMLETLLRVALAEAGLPRPVTQHLVLDHGQEVARVDFCWIAQRLIVEADGFAFHSNRDDYRRDRRRMNDLERLGWRVLRFTWEDITQRPEHVVGMVRACLTPFAA